MMYKANNRFKSHATYENYVILSLLAMLTTALSLTQFE